MALDDPVAHEQGQRYDGARDQSLGWSDKTIDGGEGNKRRKRQQNSHAFSSPRSWSNFAAAPEGRSELADW